MYIHKEKKLLFLAHPRTGSTATRNALYKIGFESCNIGHHTKLTPKNKNIYLDYTIFSTVRNHFETCLTWAMINKQYRHNNPKFFSVEQTRDIILAVDETLIEQNKLFYHTRMSDIVLKYETLEEDLTQLLLKHELILTQPFEKTNVTKAKQGMIWQEAFSYAAIQYIIDRFKDEIEEFGYMP